MKIHCQDCNEYCGEIRDATLRKGTTFLCNICNSGIPTYLNKTTYKDKEAVDMLKNMFGMKA